MLRLGMSVGSGGLVLIDDAIRTSTSLDRGASSAYAKYGDLAAVGADVFAGRLPSGLSITDVALWADELRGRATRPRRRTILRDMFARLSALEAQYSCGSSVASCRSASDEALIEEALAAAFSQPLDAVRRATALGGDIGEVATLARRRMLTPLPAACDGRPNASGGTRERTVRRQQTQHPEAGQDCRKSCRFFLSLVVSLPMTQVLTGLALGANVMRVVSERDLGRVNVRNSPLVPSCRVSRLITRNQSRRVVTRVTARFSACPAMTFDSQRHGGLQHDDGSRR
jgi:hypothetical protein